MSSLMEIEMTSNDVLSDLRQSDDDSSDKRSSDDPMNDDRNSADDMHLDNLSDDELQDDHTNDVIEADEPMAEGGYGWVLVFACFVFYCVEMGTVKSFGVFVPMVIADLETSTGLVGFAFGLVQGLTYLLSAMWTVWYTLNRLVLYVAATLSILSLVAMSFCHNEILLVLFSAITGIGYSFFPVWTIMAIREYFSERFPVALSLTMAGAAVGMGLFPILAGVLTDIYGWRGSLLIIAGINAHIVVVAMLTRTPDQRSPSTGRLTASHQSAAVNLNLDDCDGDQSQRLNHKRNDAANRTSINTRFKGYIKTLLDKILITNIHRDYPELQLLPLLSISLGFIITGIVVFLVPSAIDKGIDLEKASFLSSLFGIGTLTGRVSIGFIITRTGWTPAAIMCLLYPVCAVSFIVFATCRIYIVLAVNSFINAMCLGALGVAAFLLYEKTLPKKLFRGAFFLYAFFYGLGSPIGGLLAGKYKDWTSSYDFAFFFFAVLSIVSLVILFHLMWQSSRKKRTGDRERLLMSHE